MQYVTYGILFPNLCLFLFMQTLNSLTNTCAVMQCKTPFCRGSATLHNWTSCSVVDISCPSHILESLLSNSFQIFWKNTSNQIHPYNMLNYGSCVTCNSCNSAFHQWWIHYHKVSTHCLCWERCWFNFLHCCASNYTPIWCWDKFPVTYPVENKKGECTWLFVNTRESVIIREPVDSLM